MDGFGNLVTVEEPKPGGGSYFTSFLYSPQNQLTQVTMTRDGYSGTTPLANVTQTRTFGYTGQYLRQTTFPETLGSMRILRVADHSFSPETDHRFGRRSAGSERSDAGFVAAC